MSSVDDDFLDVDELEESCVFFECYLYPFSQVYDGIHIPLSISICIFGTISNIFNIIVLTRKKMRSPINILLCGLSAAQWLLASNYLAFLIIEHYRMQCFALLWSEALTWYRFFNVNLNVVFHTIAFLTTIIVAVYRYFAVKYPLRASSYLYKPHIAVGANIAVWIIVPLMCVPVFFISKVKGIDGDYMNCSFTEPMFDLNYQANPVLVSAVFWMFGIVLKLIPSLVLTVLLIALIRSLKSVERRRNKWKHATRPRCTGSDARAGRKFSSRPRTTRMLVIILLLCVVVELPNGILNLLMAIYGEEFGIRIYDHVATSPSIRPWLGSVELEEDRQNRLQIAKDHVFS
ncbi:unnamed protein product [Cylicocyclus nassatus]|uniref:G-protein coupled receptors family 1 profile domain-containing protein n=1 Tax=Cylicocyclus nassatus TaxID=53992 RepID=A0AA36MI63_CYLNA|nr:unnamed protein product [Cylicocyclus nassatus]